MECSIDKFHFKNHVDAYCHEHFDPNKKKDLDRVNTEICEQLFVRVNEHKNCKSMNEAREKRVQKKGKKATKC